MGNRISSPTSKRPAIPQKTTILVVGGGPAGSYTAGLLAREGHDVVLLESTTHPRYHIGESLLPSIIPHLRFFGAEEKVRAHGFTPKVGAAAKFVQSQEAAYTDFIEFSEDMAVWNVERADFDNIMFRHAGSLGVKLFENASVTQIDFSATHPDRPVAARYRLQDGSEGRIEFEYLVDASGRNGLMSTRYLKNRVIKKSLQNIATWGYWEGVEKYAPGTPRENAPWFEALTDGSGWAWKIPLKHGKTSLGIVVHESINVQKRKQCSSLEEHYLKMIPLAPGIQAFLKNARRIEDEPLRQASDYSYACTKSGGDHWRLVGDAAQFIDPLFSSGVHLAFVSGLAAAATICAAMRGDATEAEAAAYHDRKSSIAYTRFLIVVLGVYKQIRNQDIHVLSDVDDTSFQAAFDLLRPVIQGHVDTQASDVGKKDAMDTVDPEHVRQTIEFCSQTYAKAYAAQQIPDQAPEVQQLVKTKDVVAPTTKEMSADEIRAMSSLHETMDAFLLDSVNGFVTRLEAKNLGLKRASPRARVPADPPALVPAQSAAASPCPVVVAAAA